MKVLVFLSLVFFASCGTVGYQKAGDNGFRLGYSEVKLTKNKYRVKYLGKESTIVYKRFLKRCSEIAINNKYKYFTIKEVGSLTEGVSIGVGIGRSFSSIQNPQYEATVVFSNKKSEDSFSAKELIVE